MPNADLSNARKNKNDEFYTQWVDIEREMNAFLEYSPDLFRGKVLLLPCDDPEWSNFVKFFALHFVSLGLKKLISTSFAANSKPSDIPYQPTIFETSDAQFDAGKTRSNGKAFVLEGKDVSGDGVVNIDDLRWEYLEGDGDFRSAEVRALLAEADIVVTNPPFSLFREFLAWLLEGQVQFAVIGNSNVVTTRDIFPLVKSHQVWLGPTAAAGGHEFRVPDNYPLVGSKCRVAEDGTKFITVKGVRWLTNIEHGRRHEPLQLMTEADNIRFSRHKQVQGHEYRKYDNFDAIDVSFTDAIPRDYPGLMGVPITFLDRYNPDQFEIVGITKTWFGAATKIYPQQVQISSTGARSLVSKLNDGAVIWVAEPPIGKTHYQVDDEFYIQTYPRILVRNRMLS